MKNLTVASVLGANPQWPFECQPGPANRLTDSSIYASRIAIFAAVESVDSVETLKQSLGRAGFDNISVTNEFAAATFAIEENAIDLLVIDGCNFSDGSGQQLATLCSQRNVSSLVLLRSSSNAQIKKVATELLVDDFLARPIDAIEAVSRVKNTLSSKLAAEQLADLSAQLQTDTLLDPLTKIANRRAFDFELSRRVIQWERQRIPLALLMIDIDYFKSINDEYGHPAGDSVLQQVAEKLQSAVREMDLVCRYGGEEFAAILPVKRRMESVQTAERIRQLIADSHFDCGGANLSITVSIGLAETMKGDDQGLLVKRADTALYEAKRNGRNRVTFHDGARCQQMHGGDSVCGPDSVCPFSWAVKDDVINLCSAKILIVDNSSEFTLTAKADLEKAGFQHLLCESNSQTIINNFAKNPPDLLVLDLSNSDTNCFGLLQQIFDGKRNNQVPAIVVASHADQQTKAKCLQLGISDFLYKPVIANELAARVRNTLLASAHTRFLSHYSSRLEHEVKIRTMELLASRREAVQCLARAAERQDDDSGRHVIRIGKYAAIIAEALGFTDSQVLEIEHAVQLHDVGQLRLPEKVIKSRQKLTEDEFSIIKDHCSHGGKIIRDETETMKWEQNVSLFDSCSTPLMRMAALVAETHHERWDGAGYPRGLSGANIPIEGRIAAVCDVFDAISNPKAYREAFDLERCFAMIREGSGSQFDPEVVEAFFDCKQKIVQVFSDFGETTQSSHR